MPKFVFEITIDAPDYPYPEKGKWGVEATALDWLCETFQQAQWMRHRHIINHIAHVNKNADENTPFIQGQNAAIAQIDEWMKTIKFVRKE